MTLGEARSLVRNIILERVNDTGLVTDAEANELINSASRLIYIRIATKYPDVFAQRAAAPVNITAPQVLTSSAPFSAFAGAGTVFRVLNVWAGAQGALDSAMQQINNFDRVSDRQVYEPAPTPLPALPFRWFTEGETLCWSPAVSGVFQINASWVQMPATLAGDSDVIWGGKQVGWHDFVALFAATMASSKDSGAVPQLYSILDGMLGENFGTLGPMPMRYSVSPYNSMPKDPRP
jgi:hypothetical protein